MCDCFERLVNFPKEKYRFARDYRWSETGDKYIVKLFRDYVFHSVDENGRPVISLTHVLTHLNKVRQFIRPIVYGIENSW